MPHSHSPFFPQEREGSLTSKSPNPLARNVIRLNRTHLFLNLQQNFSNNIFHFHFVLWQISSKLSKICSIRPQTPQIMQNLHQLLTHLYYIMFQVPALAEKSQEFQRITQIPRNSPT